MGRRRTGDRRNTCRGRPWPASSSRRSCEPRQGGRVPSPSGRFLRGFAGPRAGKAPGSRARTCRWSGRDKRRRPAPRSASCEWPGRRSGSSRRARATRRRCGGRSVRGKTRRPPAAVPACGRRPPRLSRLGWAMASASTSVSSVRAKSACQGSRSRRAVATGLRRSDTWVKVIVPKRSSRVRQASSAAGTAAAAIPLAGMPPGPLKCSSGRQPGRSPLAGDHRDSLASWHRRPGSAPRRRNRTTASPSRSGPESSPRPSPPRSHRCLKISSPAATASRPPPSHRPWFPRPASPFGRPLRVPPVQRRPGRARAIARDDQSPKARTITQRIVTPHLLLREIREKGIRAIGGRYSSTLEPCDPRSMTVVARGSCRRQDHDDAVRPFIRAQWRH